MLLGIGLFGAITATTTSYLMTRDSQHGAEPPLVDDLEHLVALHSAGALTDEEFDRARRGSYRWRRPVLLKREPTPYPGAARRRPCVGPR